jgi:hypothetical protein
MNKLAQLTALAAAVAAAAAAPAAAMHGPGEGPSVAHLTAVPQPQTQVIRVVRTSGFDWADAAVGAGSGAGAIGVAVGAALLARRRRPEAGNAPSAAAV